MLALMALLVGLLALELVTGVKPAHDWIYHAALGLAGALCIARAVASSADRLAWACIGAGVLAWTAGDLYWVAALADVADPPYPSLADAGWIAFYPLVYAGLVLLFRARMRDVRVSLWLDGLTGAFAVAAVGTSVVLGAVLETIGGSPLAVAVNLAYPLADTLLLGLLVAMLAMVGWRATRSVALIGAGLAVFALVDSVYVYEIATETYRVGNLVDLGWPLGTALLGFAAWQPERSRSRAAGRPVVTLLPPIVFGSIALALEIYDHFDRLNLVALVLASAALAGVILRLGLTFGENLRILERRSREALSDALTGLPNRRRLLDDLRDRLESGAPGALVVADLDGFKGYNDTFGHLAGDALLHRLAARLDDAVRRAGTAYRMGGDEFCVLFDDAADPAGLSARVAAGLSESGERFAIVASCGLALLPDEAATPEEALRLADDRMYGAKRSGRSSAERQSTDVLLLALAERSHELGEHTLDVAELAEQVARALALTDDDVRIVRRAAELHDVGKVGIPDEILDKPGPLDPAEWQFMRQHTVIGERILRAAPALAPVAGLVRATHERYDGRGYPDGLAGEEIPLGARIVLVCDSFHAMTSARPYKAPMSPADALEELRRCSGTQFDPRVVDAFCALYGTAVTRLAA
jgi:diguanylate cyclase (GGDEF)-like protein/putative nucleotidyltransferase with HDIG domain